MTDNRGRYNILQTFPLEPSAASTHYDTPSDSCGVFVGDIGVMLTVNA